MERPRHPRDAQRSRVYRAEMPMPSSPLPGLDACAAYAERVVGTLWWQARFPEHGLGRVPRMRPGNGAACSSEVIVVTASGSRLTVIGSAC